MLQWSQVSETRLLMHGLEHRGGVDLAGENILGLAADSVYVKYWRVPMPIDPHVITALRWDISTLIKLYELVIITALTNHVRATIHRQKESTCQMGKDEKFLFVYKMQCTIRYTWCDDRTKLNVKRRKPNDPEFQSRRKLKSVYLVRFQPYAPNRVEKNKNNSLQSFAQTFIYQPSLGTGGFNLHTHRFAVLYGEDLIRLIYTLLKELRGGGGFINK